MGKRCVCWAGGLSLALVFAAGCGDPGARTAEVSGTVTVDGNLVEEGQIAFFPADGQGRTAGGPIKEGHYTARVPLGTLKVTVSVPKATGATRKLYGKSNSPEITIKGESLPAKYSSLDATTLRVDVEGNMEKNFDLKSE